MHLAPCSTRIRTGPAIFTTRLFFRSASEVSALCIHLPSLFFECWYSRKGNLTSIASTRLMSPVSGLQYNKGTVRGHRHDELGTVPDKSMIQALCTSTGATRDLLKFQLCRIRDSMDAPVTDFGFTYLASIRNLIPRVPVSLALRYDSFEQWQFCLCPSLGFCFRVLLPRPGSLQTFDDVSTGLLGTPVTFVRCAHIEAPVPT